MDINAVLSQARKNKKECGVSNQVSRYNTNVKPAKKLPRPNVDPSAIKAFLNKKKKDEIEDLVAAQKKKEELIKLRDSSKTTKKANAMARRTKDNLKVYKGEDILGLYTEPKERRKRPSLPPLSPEADRRHKAFMKNIVPKVKVPGINDDDSDDGYKEPVLEMDERKRRKMEKNRAKARSASNLEFSDLLQLAEKQKHKAEESSSTSEDSDSDGDSDGSVDQHGRRLTPEEKYQRERRKRRELEERLKAAASHKSPGVASNHHKGKAKPAKGDLSSFKIGKLNSGMSEESKRAKVKALMKKLKRSSEGKKDESSNSKSSESKEREGGKEKGRSGDFKSEKMRKSHSTPNLISGRDKSHEKKPNKLKHRENGIKTNRPQKPPAKNAKPHSSYARNEPSCNGAMSSKRPSTHHPSQKEKSSKTQRPQSDLRQTDISNHFKAAKRKATPNDHSSPSSSKIAREKAPISNPYKHTVIDSNSTKRPATETLTDPWAKSNKVTESNATKTKKTMPPGPPKCTLSVSSVSVKTNYPGVAQLDPYIEAYKKTGKVIPKLTSDMMARYKTAIMRKMQQQQQMGRGERPPPSKRRYGVIGDESDEYDSELEDFIVDEEEEEVDNGNVDVSSHIKAIFGYDKNKYGRESEWELSRMEASYKDIEKEEKRSLRIAREEDAREAKLEEEREKRLAMKKKKR